MFENDTSKIKLYSLVIIWLFAKNEITFKTVI